jgi:hypothetical protein
MVFDRESHRAPGAGAGTVGAVIRKTGARPIEPATAYAHVDPIEKYRPYCSRSSAGYIWARAGLPSVSESAMIARDAALAGYEDGRVHVRVVVLPPLAGVDQKSDAIFPNRTLQIANAAVRDSRRHLGSPSSCQRIFMHDNQPARSADGFKHGLPIQRNQSSHVDHFHFNSQFFCFFWKYHTCLEIPKGILLPVNKMIFRKYLE